jgi:hypothetical protein
MKENAHKEYKKCTHLFKLLNTQKMHKKMHTKNAKTAIENAHDSANLFLLHTLHKPALPPLSAHPSGHT